MEKTFFIKTGWKHIYYDALPILLHVKAIFQYIDTMRMRQTITLQLISVLIEFSTKFIL